LWQQEKPEERNFMFGGIRTEDQNDGVVPPQATLDDVMTMRELAEDIKVRDVMTTDTDLLCYRY
jgi:tyrosinase